MKRSKLVLGISLFARRVLTFSVSWILLINANTSSANISTEVEDVLHTGRLVAADYKGQGVRVGIISNGAFNYNSLVREGYLPGDVTILSQGHEMDDEGDWMLQVVHQIAPQSKLAFCAGVNQKHVITCAQDLLSQFHADIIVDDVNLQPMFYFPTSKETEFSKLARENPDVLFFTGAGNNNGGYYEGAWKSTRVTLNGQQYTAHDFGGSLGGENDPYNTITIPPNTAVNILLGTNADPNGGPVECEHDNPDIVLALLNSKNVIVKKVKSNCPILRMHYKNDGYIPRKFRISVILENKLQIDNFKLKLVVIRKGEGVSPITLKYHTAGSAGNSAAAPELNAVAAIDPNSGWHDRYLHERFANIGPQCQDFVHSGQNRWTRLTNERCYQEPRFVVPDRTVVMMNGPMGERKRPFIGDSAAGPAAAGVAALLISAHVSPRSIIRLFEKTAIPQSDAAGWNQQYGYGLINADAAAVAAGILPPMKQNDIKSKNTSSIVFHPGPNFKRYRKLSLNALHGDIRAADILNNAAKSGNLDAQTWLGIYKHYAGDNEMAAHWILKASHHGAPYAQSYLGTLYNRGWGVALDPRAAQAWWLRAAHSGVAKAMFNMGVTRLDQRGTLSDPILAAALIKAAVLRGMRNPKAIRKLAMLHARLNIRQIQSSETMANNFAADPASIPTP